MSFSSLSIRDDGGIAQMNLWYGKNLGDAMLAWEHLDRIQDLYVSIYGKTNRRSNVAVFYRHESEGRLHCEVWAYISPAAVELARAVAAEPCKQPSIDSLDLLVGPEECWTVLFPGYRNQRHGSPPKIR
jgi:hypothetical protein